MNQKTKPVIQSESLYIGARGYVTWGSNPFICRDAAQWLNPNAETGCRFAVFKRPVKGSRRVFLTLAGGFTEWGKRATRCSCVVLPQMGHFLDGLGRTETPKQFYVLLK